MDSRYEAKARIVRILAHPKRLEIVDLLSRGERTVKEIADAAGLSQSGTSQHLAILRRGGLVDVRRQGSFIHYRLVDPAIGSACRVMDAALIAVLTRQDQVVRPILASVEAYR